MGIFRIWYYLTAMYPIYFLTRAFRGDFGVRQRAKHCTGPRRMRWRRQYVDVSRNWVHTELRCAW